MVCLTHVHLQRSALYDLLTGLLVCFAADLQAQNLIWILLAGVARFLDQSMSIRDSKSPR